MRKVSSLDLRPTVARFPGGKARFATALLLAGVTVVQAGQYGDFLYRLSGEHATITGYQGSGTEVVIPESIEGYPVTEIGDWAFWQCESLTNLFIPGFVTRIGVGSFKACTGLVRVTLRAGLKTIGDSVFSDCTKLGSMTIPDTATSLGKGAFEACTSLTSVWMAAGIRTIEPGTFAGCSSLTSVTVPEGITRIGSRAFEGCTGLTRVTIPDSVRSLDTGAFRGCTKLTSLTMPTGIPSVPPEAFAGCSSLTTVTFPARVTMIASRAFACCNSLASVYFEAGVPGCQSDAFECSNAVVIYVRPGFGGWGLTVAGRPTALWIPLSLGELTKPLSAPLRLCSGSPAPAGFRVQRCTNLRDWEDWQTVSRTDGPGELNDPDVSVSPYRFYRVVEVDGE
ncbi:MAG: leucine-rich repeat domain-containing protein [Verrucomicrobiales bacterium]|nr:leucine-rich repeat domain-containing protein [Verrucomicrobiales bacterium]